jgi:hypothetical protein
MMKRRAISLIMIAVVVVLAAGCGAAAPAPLPMVREQAMDAEFAPAAPAMEPAAEEYREAGLVTEDFVSDRMIVRTASLSLVVEDTEETLAAIERLAAELKGYVSNLQTWRQDDELAGTVTVRVPSDSFDQARERIKDLALEMESETVAGQDVTEQYVDLESRLRNLEVMEGEYLEMLATAQENYKDAESILAIYQRLTEVRLEIEQITGRMRYLENVSDLATLTITLTPEEIEEPVVEPGWEPLKRAREALRALVSALQALADVLIWVGLFLVPLAAVLALPLVLVWLGWYLRRRRKGRSKSD